AEAEPLVHAHVGVGGAVFCEALLEQRYEGEILGRVDLCRHSGRIALEPDAVHGRLPTFGLFVAGQHRPSAGKCEVMTTRRPSSKPPVIKRSHPSSRSERCEPTASSAPNRDLGRHAETKGSDPSRCMSAFLCDAGGEGLTPFAGPG